MDCDPPAGEEGAKRRSAQKLIERWILQKNGRISRDFPEKADKVSLAGTTTNWPLGAVKSARTPIAPPVQPLFLQMKRQPRLSTSSKYICLQHLLVMMMLSSTCPIILLFPDPSSFVSETRGRGYGCGWGGDTDPIVPYKAKPMFLKVPEGASPAAIGALTVSGPSTSSPCSPRVKGKLVWWRP